jgi:hypothetical protein
MALIAKWPQYAHTFTYGHQGIQSTVPRGLLNEAFFNNDKVKIRYILAQAVYLKTPNDKYMSYSLQYSV